MLNPQIRQRIFRLTHNWWCIWPSLWISKSIDLQLSQRIISAIQSPKIQLLRFTFLCYYPYSAPPNVCGRSQIILFSVEMYRQPLQSLRYQSIVSPKATNSTFDLCRGLTVSVSTPTSRYITQQGLGGGLTPWADGSIPLLPSLWEWLITKELRAPISVFSGTMCPPLLRHYQKTKKCWHKYSSKKDSLLPNSNCYQLDTLWMWQLNPWLPLSPFGAFPG